MICNTCRRTLARAATISRSNIRRLASTTSTETVPSEATSAGVPNKSQPFSEPFFPSTSTAKTAPASQTYKVTSSVPGGTSLSSLTYTKPTNTSKPLIALEDHEYPSWLWTLVADPNAPSQAVLDGGVDVATMTKKSRAKYERKQAKLAAGLEKPIPLHEQSKDLTGPGDDAIVSTQARTELTKSMRSARRKEIRETNFLKSM